MNEEFKRSTSKESIISAVSRVGNWEIGDRCQIGDRSGSIMFIGETKFAPGEWIGVVLDEPFGRNDGTVDGYSYFTCEPNHGLFCKASKLKRKKSTSPANEPQTGNPFEKEFGMSVGDRVIVSGGKIGTLRFLGPTEFREGIWAGIELDQPVGKNDGSVQGKRYFTCKAPHGLFAAAAKVARAPEQNPAKIKIRHTKTSALRQRSGSHESLISIGASSIATSRLSKFYFSAQKIAQRPVIISSSRGQDELFRTMQESLKEKEVHLEQMIRERDIERNEMVLLLNRCEIAEARVAQLESSLNGFGQATALQAELEITRQQSREFEDQIHDLTIQLKEQKDMYEMLTFRCDEESIVNAELKEKIEELEEAAAINLQEFLRTVTSDDDAGVRAEEIFTLAGLSSKERTLRSWSIIKKHLNDLNLKWKESGLKLTDFGEITDKLSEELSTVKSGAENHAGNALQVTTELGVCRSVLTAVINELTGNEDEMAKLQDRCTAFISSKDAEILTKLKNLKEEGETYSAELDNWIMKFEKLSAEYEQLQGRSVALENENSAMKESKIILESDLARSSEKLKVLSAEVVALNETISQKSSNELTLTESLKQKDLECKEWKRKAEEMHEHVRLDSENSALKERKNILERELSESVEKMESLSATIVELNETIRQQNANEITLTESLKQSEVACAEWKQKAEELNEQLNSSIGALKKDLDDLRREKKKEEESSSAQVEEFLAARASLQKELLDANAICHDTKAAFALLNEEYCECKLKMANLESELIAARQQRTAGNVRIGELEDENEKMSMRVNQLENERAERQMHHASDITKLQDRVSELVQELTDLRSKNADITTEKQSLFEELAKIKTRFEALTESLKTRIALPVKEEKLKILTARLQSLESSLNSVDCQGATLEEKIGNLLKERAQSSSALKQLKEKVKAMVAENFAERDGCTFAEEHSAGDMKIRDDLPDIPNRIENDELLTRDSMSVAEKEDETLHKELSLKQVNDVRQDTVCTAKDMQQPEILHAREGQAFEAVSELENKSGMASSEAAYDAKIAELKNENLDLKEKKVKMDYELSQLRIKALDLERKLIDGKITVAEAFLRSSDIGNAQAEWSRKEAEYLQTISDLKAVVGKTESEKVSAMKCDIEFLNSIIAEQRTKQKDLEERIAVLNSSSAKEMHDDLRKLRRTKPPPRLYCDICELFDLHDTTDCPKQVMDEEDDSNFVKQSKSQCPPPRPYCKNCEMFGHDTTECCETKTEDS